MIQYRVVGLLYTLTCPLECRDCIVSASPRVHEKMTPAFASECIKVIAKYTDSLCFTGGEPMLYYNEILPLIREAKALGLKVSMVTGSGWVRTDKEHIARERIFGLKEAGMDTICASWDSYHEEFAPPENPLLVLRLCQEAGIPVYVRGVIGANGDVPRIGESLVQINIEYQKVPLVRLGNAETLPDDHFRFSTDMDRFGGPCNIVQTPAIEPDGTVYACCGPSRTGKSKSSPLVLGNVNDENLDSILSRAVNDPVIEAINLIGPYGLFKLIKDEPSLQGILPIRDRYTSFCEICLDLCDTSAVVDKIRERLSTEDARKLLIAAKLFAKATPEMRQLTYSNSFM